MLQAGHHATKVANTDHIHQDISVELFFAFLKNSNLYTVAATNNPNNKQNITYIVSSM